MPSLFQVVNFLFISSDIPVAQACVNLHLTTHNVIIGFVLSIVLVWTRLSCWHKTYPNNATFLLCWIHRYKNDIAAMTDWSTITTYPWSQTIVKIKFKRCLSNIPPINRTNNASFHFLRRSFLFSITDFINGLD
jgi:hypothetical protein